jgi:hypothetical protein
MGRTGIGMTVLACLVVALVIGVPFCLYYESSQATIAELRSNSSSLRDSLGYYQQIVSSLQGQVTDLSSQISAIQSQYGTLMPFLTEMPSNSRAIQLDAQLQESSITVGGTASLAVSLNNTLAQPNNLTGSWYFPSVVGDSLSRPVCGSNMPVGATAFRGYYDLGNVTLGEPLGIFDPLPVPCPFPTNDSWMVFYPLSTTALIQPSLTTSAFPYVALEMSWTFQLKGYWTGDITNVTFHQFESGVYTVVVGDVWGHVALLYLQVK